ncbi:hypothetical protein A4H97_28150 [Niastella yeongjuensis]|uniref:Secretion system C-terminal sorting domain-containing protein n=2 Tax=Niastella yeongjuensis TaxID=354355 RepID=A0A1V9EV81_9BACT|nr:hypothetical protein A4H97_28150 [Niastella yeongjuensis]
MNTALTALAQPKYKVKLVTQIYCPKNDHYREVCSGNFINEAAQFFDGSRVNVAQGRLNNPDNGFGHDLNAMGQNGCTGAVKRYFEDSITYETSRWLTSIWFRSKTDESPSFGSGCTSLCDNQYNWPVNTGPGVVHQFHSDPFPCYYGNTELWIYPERIDITDPSGEKYLPSTARIDITATPGYPMQVYNWQYNIGGTGWVDFPAATNTAGKTSIQVSGYDLMGTNFDTIRHSSVFIRVKEDFYESETLTLKPTIPAPRITALTPIANKCFGESNGTITVQFDRALVPGESLSIILKDTINRPPNITAPDVTLDADNKYTFPDTLAPGGFKVDLLGSIITGPDTIASYTREDGHHGVTGFVSPAAVGFNNGARDVYCYGGADGIINLTATGGDSSYRAGYKKVQDANWQWVPFASVMQHTITGLDSGVYQLRVVDGNNCFTKDAGGNEKIATQPVDQPAQPLLVDHREFKNPLAYGYTDGQALAIIIGGTPFNGNSYNVTWNNVSTGAVLSMVTNSVNPFTTTLQQIGDGAYIVTATDGHYALTSGANTAGCIVRDTFQLHQPPPLVVTVSENKYVSCNGVNDGELYANAQGGIEIPGQRYVYQLSQNINGFWAVVHQGDSIVTNVGAGTYKMAVTDSNNITRESVPFTLTQPNVLAVNLSSTPVDCHGGTNGTASAIISGGTTPYSLDWSTGSTALTITGLQQGGYLAYVKDAHGCEVQQQVKVLTPNPILINNAVVTPPVCTGFCNGAINYNTSGGVPPYSYRWSNGSTTPAISGLCIGTYKVTIADTRGCTTQDSFIVKDPLPLTIDLGPDITLCAGQTWLASAEIADPHAVYSWNGPNGYSAATAAASLVAEGKYEVQVTDSKGCKGGDAITITRSNATVAAEFFSSTQGFKGSKITFVNMSKPWPETVAWLLPAGNAVTVVRKNDSLAELQFNDTGTYRIGMRSGVGSCSKEYYNSITILEGQSFNDPGTTTDPFVLDFKVAPNPSNGQFTVTVGLQDVADINLRLVNLLTGAILDERRQRGSKNYSVPYNINLGSGVYALVLETANDSRIFRVLIL